MAAFRSLLIDEGALWLQTQGEDPVINQFYQRAVTRLNEPLPEPSWETMWPGYGHNIWEWNQRHYGLAVTWGLIHDNSLRVAADDAADDAEADAAVAVASASETVEAVQQEEEQQLELWERTRRASAAHAFANS